jgi:phosphatidylinositol-3-phosphatase
LTRGMRSRAARVAGIVAVVGALLAPSTSSVARAADPVPRFSRIMVVVIENQSFTDIFEKNPAAHYILDQLTPQSALATRFYPPKRNSPTAYFAITSGFTYADGDSGNWAGKCGPSTACSAKDPTVFQQLVGAGGSWRIYSEDQQQPCQTTLVKKYWVGHNPAVFYPALGPNSYTTTGDGSCREYDISFNELRSDLAGGTVPAYSLVIPNNCNNMHDACYPVHDRVAQGNAWLEKAMKGDELVAGGLIQWVQQNDTLLVITFDEARLDTDREGCCPYRKTGGGGHVPMWVIGPADKVQPGTRSKVQLSTFSILRTVEENWGLPLLGHAADPVNVGLGSLLVPARQAQAIPSFPPTGSSGQPSSPPSSQPANASPSASGGAVPAQGSSPGAATIPPVAIAPQPTGASSTPGWMVAAMIVAALAVLGAIGFAVFRRRASDAGKTGGGPAARG